MACQTWKIARVLLASGRLCLGTGAKNFDVDVNPDKKLSLCGLQSTTTIMVPIMVPLQVGPEGQLEYPPSAGSQTFCPLIRGVPWVAQQQLSSSN